MFKPPTYTIKSKVWLWSGSASWHFVNVPEEISAEIKYMFGYLKAGWGSLPVKLTVKERVWKTSLFPNNKTNCYIIPIKAEIRKKEKINVDDELEIKIEVVT